MAENVMCTGRCGHPATIRFVVERRSGGGGRLPNWFDRGAIYCAECEVRAADVHNTMKANGEIVDWHRQPA